MNENSAPYPAWIYRQSAVLPYRFVDGSIEVLLITSRGGKRWVLPKGIVEPGMSAVDSARKEAREEAGVDGIASQTALGTYRYDKWGGTCAVQVYPLEVAEESDDWPEAAIRRRRWFSLRKAQGRVEQKQLRELIERLPTAVPARAGPAPAGDGIAAPRPERLVYLFRHAKSSWSDPGLADDERPLADRGERACEAIGRYMMLGDVHPDLVLCSSAVRTRQTLERVLPSLGEHVSLQFYRTLYLAGPQAMLRRLQQSADEARSVMLIGHNPGMHSLALRLTGSGDAADRERLAMKFPTAALAILVYRGSSWAALADGSCELHSLVLPREVGAAA